MHPDAREEWRKNNQHSGFHFTVLIVLGHVGVGMNWISFLIYVRLEKFAFCLEKWDLPFSCQNCERNERRMRSRQCSHMLRRYAMYLVVEWRWIPFNETDLVLNTAYIELYWPSVSHVMSSRKIRRRWNDGHEKNIWCRYVVRSEATQPLLDDARVVVWSPASFGSVHLSLYTLAMCKFLCVLAYWYCMPCRR